MELGLVHPEFLGISRTSGAAEFVLPAAVRADVRGVRLKPLRLVSGVVAHFAPDLKGGMRNRLCFFELDHPTRAQNDLSVQIGWGFFISVASGKETYEHTGLHCRATLVCPVA